jgi:hypothetical protein
MALAHTDCWKSEPMGGSASEMTGTATREPDANEVEM